MRTRPFPALRAALAAAAAVVLVGLATGCGAAPTNSTAVAPGGNPEQLPGPYTQFDRDAAQMVHTVAQWDAPKSLVVNEATRIALSMGQSKEISDRVERLVKDAVTTPAGEVVVGSTVAVTLQADPEDAEITPSDKVNVSTGSDIAMLWTWLVKAKHPTDGLELTAHMEIPLSDGHVATNDLPFSIPVTATFGYRANQVATNWATWSGVATSIIGVGGWFLRRRQKRRKAANAAPAESSQTTSV
jgi:LPXTG-motif cell wall-anchored protein